MIKSWVACTPRVASSSVSKLVLKSRRIATINGHSKHTENIGSLLRPRELKDAFGARMRGTLEEAQFREIQERCIVEAIRLQERTGLDTITDGEFRRVAWSTGFVSALDGLESRQSIFEFREAAGNSQRWDTCYAS